MIAYGYPELIDPTPGDSFMMMTAEWRKEMEQKFSNPEDGSFMPDKLDALTQELADYLYEISNGAPGEEMKQLFKLLEEGGKPENWD
jgi:hypothetical protein